MNKEEILDFLEKYKLDKNQVIIISGAAMVINNIKDSTKDIDIAVSAEYEKKLLEEYNCKLERTIQDKGKTFNAYMIDDIINFSNHYYDDYDYEIVDGYKIQTPEEILRLKMYMNREKDGVDIFRLRNFINVKNMNSLNLAYLGDAVYELYIREFLIKKNMKGNELQKKSIEYVSAKRQSTFLDKMIEENFLKLEEIKIVKRARNHKSHSNKSTDIITYKKSTGLEALIGYLKLTNNDKRIDEIMKYIIGDEK